jgi:hypothetical protein
MNPADFLFPGHREREATAVGKALAQSLLPTPDAKNEEWKAIAEHYKLPQPVLHDKVLSKVQLPTGWTVSANRTDNRRMVITDHEGKTVGGSFLKDTGYDYYGSVYFDRDRLVELGVLKSK